MKAIITIILLSLSIIQIKSDKPSQVIEFANSKIGCGYVWGAKGQILTQSLLQSFKRQHPDHVDESIVKKWLGKQVFDCAGFVHCAFQTVGINLATGATSIWNQKNLFEQTGKINTLPKNKVCILFRQDKDKPSVMAHTGIYVLNGRYIHSGGSKTGVQPGNMNGSWTHWALPKGLYSGDQPTVETQVCSSYPCQAKVGNASGTVNLREGPSTSKGVIIRVKVGETVTVNSYKSGWYNITYNGKTGYMMGTYLVKL